MEELSLEQPNILLPPGRPTLLGHVRKALVAELHIRFRVGFLEQAPNVLRARGWEGNIFCRRTEGSKDIHLQMYQNSGHWILATTELQHAVTHFSWEAPGWGCQLQLKFSSTSNKPWSQTSKENYSSHSPDHTYLEVSHTELMETFLIVCAEHQALNCFEKPSQSSLFCSSFPVSISNSGSAYHRFLP